MNIIELASEVLGIPANSEDNINFLTSVVWEHTGYPSFYSGNPEEYFRRQLEEFKSIMTK